jgi:hypothetical protein
VSRFLDAFRAGAEQGKGEKFGVPCPENPEFSENPQGAREEIGPPEGFRDFGIFGTGKGQKVRFHLLSISLRYPTPLVRLAAIASGCAALSCPVVPARGAAPAAPRHPTAFGLTRRRWSLSVRHRLVTYEYVSRRHHSREAPGTGDSLLSDMAQSLIVSALISAKLRRFLWPLHRMQVTGSVVSARALGARWGAPEVRGR